jgi:hypothetical protein
MMAAARAPGSTPRGPAIDVSINYNGGRCRSSRQYPRGPAVDIFINYNDGRCRSSRQHPRGPAIDVSVNYNGGRCRSSRQNPQGARRRCRHQLRFWPLPEPLAAPPGGQQSMCAWNGTCHQHFCCATPTRGALWPTLLRQAGQSFAGKYSLKRAEDPGNITAKRFIHQTQDKVIYLQNV